jgi:hypothetical protein
MCGGVEHRWAPSTAFCLPDGMQERIGEKEVGLLMLMLDGTDHRFATGRPDGLRRNNILDHPQLYPGLAELRVALGREPCSEAAPSLVVLSLPRPPRRAATGRR